jgi:hypothetical protein
MTAQRAEKVAWASGLLQQSWERGPRAIARGAGSYNAVPAITYSIWALIRSPIVVAEDVSS